MGFGPDRALLRPPVTERPMPSPPETIASWHPGSPRDEIRPDFAIDPAGGRDGVGALVISMDGREGLHGYWRRAFPSSPMPWDRWWRASATAKRACSSHPAMTRRSLAL